MKYYNKDGEVFEYTIKDRVNSGTQGTVYTVAEDDHICLKKYQQNIDTSLNPYADSNTRFSIETFEYLQNYGAKCIYELYQLLYNQDLTRTLGYTSAYYQNIINDILNQPIEYLLDSFNTLYELINKFSSDHFRIVDFHSNNIILADDGIRIIDMDKCYFDKNLSLHILREVNLLALYYTFRGILIASLKRNNLLNNENSSIVNYMFKYGTTPLALKIKTRSKDRCIDMFNA